MPDRSWQDHALLALLALMWSTSFLFIKIAVQGIGPFTLVAIRMAVAAAVLAAVLFAAGGGRLSATEWRIAVVVGLIGNALPFFLIGQGETVVDSALAAILMGIMPVATAVVAHLVFAEERLGVARSLGMALGFAGLVVLVGPDALAGLGRELAAQLFILGGALCYAMATIYVRYQGQPLDGRRLAFGSSIAGFAWIAPFSLLLERPWSLSPSTAELGAALILGVFCTGVAALLYFRLIHSLGPVRFAQINNVIPLLGMLWGMIFLKEHPGVGAAIALVLISAGIYLVNRRRPDRRPPGSLRNRDDPRRPTRSSCRPPL